MRAFKNGDQGYYCDKCKGIFDEDSYSSSEVYYLPRGANECDCCSNYVRVEDVSEENAWLCGEGCFHHDEGSTPPIVDLWECDECGEVYADSQMAADCCQ